MRLIFTHNNADFDAIASLLALVKLDPTATPVLPQRLHQNVRKFLTLYAGLLPTLPAEDLTHDPEYVYLVDTQKYHNIPGLGATTPVHIIDHHPLKHKLPKHFTFWGDTVGSTTTLLVERIQQEDINLSILEATLLIMGIYEDTGSLTYGGTTPRDLQAAAWLLAQGAKLDLLRDFLTYPLEDKQWQVYDQLRESPDIVEIEGHSIIIGSAVVPEQVSDISTIVHQLANLYDPHALFVLVQMATNVQMVARSSVDQIDVGVIARQFGGGGHGRAAAALIRNTHLEAVQQRLHDILAEVVQPSVTVRDLMSAGPIETITDTASVAEAHHLMTISGHEGYPVLRGGRVVGLLTRRAVDRAMSHQLRHLPVSQIMETGSDIYVSPTDSLETLRQKMMDTGWGQMPVLNGGQQLIGIVTRTDLIRRWGQGADNYRQQRLIIQHLQHTLPEGLWVLLKQIAQHAQAHSLDLYLVGGIVRDLLLGVPNLDLDLVVEGDAISLVRHLQAKWGGDMRYHQQFGTAKWLLTADVAKSLGVVYSAEWPEFIDFATARAEFYKEPTVLPTVRQSSIKQDLHRRDFTINSMAIRLAPEPMGALIDYYNGERDLDQKIIRVLHSLSFVDDPTRMVRAVRFEQRLGFVIEPRTESLMRDALPLLNRVTGDRIRHELRLILYELNPLQTLRRLEALGILGELIPDIQIDTWFVGAYRAFISAKHHPPWQLTPHFDSWQIGTLALLTRQYTPPQIEVLAKRLLLSRTQAQILLAFHKAYPIFYTWPAETPPSQIVDLLEPMAEVGWLVLWAAAPTAHYRRLVVQFVTEWRHIKPVHDGRQLQARGVAIGPMIGKLLRDLRRAWLDNEITTPEQEEIYLNRLLQNGFPNSRDL